MRLAWKLATSLVATTLLVLAVKVVADRRHQAELVDIDIDSEMRVARATRVLATAVAEKGGPEVVRHMIEVGDAELPRILRWLDFGDLPVIEGRDLRRELLLRPRDGPPVWAVRDIDGDTRRFTYLPIVVDGKIIGVIEMSESMAPRVAYYRREQVQTATMGLAVIVLSASLAAFLGRRLVHQPLDVIRRGMRAIGEGHYDQVRPLTRHDELGEISSELAALGTRLAARERLLHEDRLRTVGQLASGVAHELGTPLSVIGLRANAIAAGETNAGEAAKSAKVIAEQADRMSALVRQLLDYARRPAGQHALVDARDVARRASDMLAPLARARHVALEIVPATEPASVEADPAQLEQVITNLVLNAVQAMPGGGTVRLACGHGRLVPPAGHGEPGDRCWIEVADDGPGVAPEHLPHLFEPFFTTKGVGEGTGLGLAVAQTIAEEHGGWIAVESSAGKGARFRLVLPAAHVAAERLAS
jgi:signal transduction histidine kinase